METPGLSAKRRAHLLKHFALCHSGYFTELAIANNNPQPKPLPEITESSDEVISSAAKRKKSSVQKIFEDDRWSPLQKELGCIRSKNQEKKYDFVELIHRLENFEPIDESSFDFKSAVHRIRLNLMDLLEYKNLTFTGVRHIQERVSAPIFMNYIWAKSAKKWHCTKK